MTKKSSDGKTGGDIKYSIKVFVRTLTVLEFTIIYLKGFKLRLKRLYKQMNATAKAK